MRSKGVRTTRGTNRAALALVAVLGAAALVAAACTPPAPDPNAAPTARVSATPTVGLAPLTVQFSSAASSDSDGSIAFYLWNFGDGSPTSTEANPTYTYTSTGAFIATLTVTDNRGATSSSTVTIDTTNGTDPGANRPPTAVLTPNSPTSGKAPLSVSFSSLGSGDVDGSIVSYNWNWGDGTTPGSTPNASHVFAAPGSYTVVLTVTDDDGATGTSSTVVTAAANQPPAASVTITPTERVVTNPISFSSAGSVDPDGTIVSYRWDFGDGSPLSTAANPTHTYSAVGTYNVSLRVVDDNGVADTRVVPISVLKINDVPVAAANASPTSGKAPLAVAFSSAGTVDIDGTIAAYSWDFGDGSPVSADANPTHTYAALGTYTATLTVTDDRGATDSADVTVNVAAPNVPATVVASVDPTYGKVPLPVQFSSAGTSDSDGTVVAYEWDFGDGSPVSTEENPSHVYATAGIFVATLTVTDSDGATSSTTVTLERVLNVFPTVVASGTPTSGKGPLTVAFSSDGTVDTDGTIAGYSWDFGDGSPVSTDANPTHTFAPSATPYTVTLTVTDDSGDSDQATVSIFSAPNVVPTAVANSDVAAGNAPLTVAFSSAGSVDPDGSIASYSWDFGDGSPVSTDANPTHTYTVDGSYSAVLTVTDDEGATNSAAVTITVAPNPAPVAVPAITSVTPVTAKVPATVAFNSDASSDDATIVAYEWDFGDGSPVSTDADPTHVYTAVGNYTASLTVTDNGGLTATATVDVTVIPNLVPVAQAAATPESGKEPLVVAFSSAGSTDPDGTVVGYSWDFGDGSPVSTDENPTHTYDPGSFTATLTVTDDDGNTDTATVAISVTANVAPVVVANASPTTGKAPLSVSFSSAGTVDNDGTITGYSWNFGDGSPVSTDENPTHTYTAQGVYTATLSVTDDNGDVGTGTVTFNVAAPNVPATVVASGTPTESRAPFTVNFSSAGSNDADGTIVSYLWDFGDGSPTSSDANPSHLYSTVGTYTATLTLTDSDGATSTGTVTIVSNPNFAPTAAATATPSVGRAPLTVAFDSSGSTDPDDSVASVSWDFGDGSPVSTEAAPTHVYTAIGTYTATLTVTDEYGATDDTTVTITANANQAPVAVAASDVTSGLAPLAVAFDGTGSTDPDDLGGANADPIVSYEWDFGDGSPAVSGATASHTYAAAGDYTATLTVTDGSGATGTDTVTVSVLETSVYVRSDGSDSALGTAAAPKATIAGALAAAAARGQDEVRVAGGSYAGFTVVAGIDVIGGYDQNFVAGGGDGATTVTVTGAAGSPGVVANGATVATTLSKLSIAGGGGANATGVLAQAGSVLTLDQVTVTSGTASGAGSSAYGVRAVGGSDVTITASSVSAGDGVAGGVGAAGSAAANAGNGNNASGTSTGGGVSGSPTNRNGGGGGAGGGGSFALTTSQRAGSAGSAGGGSPAAAGGSGGPASTSGVGGGGGGGGAGGAAGAAGAGATAGTFGDTFAGGSGSAGAAGGAGNGGGGGGGGGGFNAFSGARQGGGGGGGGLGALGGGGGAAGQAGGGSFAVYANASTVTVTDSTLATGSGGAGGDGGAGGAGGKGGNGGNGGNITNNPAGGGGGGGAGGGAGGSGGGGGLGGPAIGAYAKGGTLTVTNSTVTLGTAGAGGAGGAGGAAGSGGSGGALGTSNTAGRNGFAGNAGSTAAAGSTGTAGAAGTATETVQEP